MEYIPSHRDRLTSCATERNLYDRCILSVEVTHSTAKSHSPRGNPNLLHSIHMTAELDPMEWQKLTISEQRSLTNDLYDRMTNQARKAVIAILGVKKPPPGQQATANDPSATTLAGGGFVHPQEDPQSGKIIYRQHLSFWDNEILHKDAMHSLTERLNALGKQPVHRGLPNL